MPFGFALGVLGLYTLFTPWLLWTRGEDTIAGIPYGPHLHEALGVYVVGIGVLIAAWAALPVQRHKEWAGVFARVRWQSVVALLLIYLVVYCYALHQAGVPLREYVQWKRSDLYLNLFGKHWPNPLADKAADGLVSVGYLLGIVLPWVGLPLGIGWVLLFSLAGFRYRTLILVGGWVLAGFLYIERKTGRWLLFGLVLLAGIGMAWLTLNRIRLSQRLFQRVDNDLSHFDLRLLANETNNSQTFRVLLGYYHAHGSRADGTLATPSFVAVRAIPSFLFPDKKKPVAPLLTHIRQAYDATPAGGELHPAVSNIEEYYLGYGMAGVVVGMGLLALFVPMAGGPRPAPLSVGNTVPFPAHQPGLFAAAGRPYRISGPAPGPALYLVQLWTRPPHPKPHSLKQRWGAAAQTSPPSTTTGISPAGGRWYG